MFTKKSMTKGWWGLAERSHPFKESENMENESMDSKIQKSVAVKARMEEGGTLKMPARVKAALPSGYNNNQNIRDLFKMTRDALERISNIEDRLCKIDDQIKKLEEWI